jgi:hypothetical protein
MSDSASAPPRFWPPPPETAEVKKEQIKLSVSVVNALAIACIVAGFVGPVITTVPETEPPWCWSASACTSPPGGSCAI